MALQLPGTFHTHGSLAGESFNKGLVEGIKRPGEGMGRGRGDQGRSIVLRLISCTTPTTSPLVERIGTVNIDTAR